MRENERSRDAQLDDWFDEPETADAWSARVDRLTRERQAQLADEPAIEDWLDDRPAPARGRSTASRLPSRPVVLVAGLLVLLLLGVLAAAGVFSGSSPKTAATSTTTTPATRSTPATTSTVTHPKTPVPAGPLKPGDQGPAVSELQRALKRAGYSPGTIDGVYGSGTTQAVTSFQQAKGLTADGIAGAQTLAALEHALQAG
jgi:lysozyme family protein